MIELENNRRAFYQWELNQRVRIDGYKPGTRVEFSARYDCKNSSLPVASYEEAGHVYAPVPNILLQAAGYIRVYVNPSANDAQKPQEKDIKVVRREKPENYEYSETPLLTIDGKLDKFFGTENSGKAIVVGVDGYATTAKVSTSEGGMVVEDDGQGNISVTVSAGITVVDDGNGNITVT